MQDLEKVLEHYGIKGRVIKTNRGPLITQIEYLPAAGTKVKNITSYLDDIARELGVSSLRVEPIENLNNLGFEVPREDMQTVDFNAILNSGAFRNAKGTLPICLGVDITGTPFFADLAKMPHLLIAGTTGSGKSVGLNTFILSLIKQKTPDELKFVLIDPKRIEFSVYNNQKYMLFPVVTDNAQAAETLKYLVGEMEKRYSLFEQSFTKNIEEYNAKEGGLSYIVCIIDEFADLMVSNKNVEKYIQLLTQKARACGIHIMLATQRPSVDVVTGVLKANFPTRLSYKVASATDSRTILDTSGAEKLIGRGDALFLQSNGELKRIHGAYMPDENIAKMLEPYRAAVKPFAPVKNKEISETPTSKPEEEKSVFRKGLEWWSSLRRREKKTIISGAIVGAGYLLGKIKKK
ncbi:MAG: hypothetical protein LBR70_02630 [Lactobacillaceae bacterium]|jgi:S-DNA-T family DNA segregation ATPase FtsK/SpoIIIE|nr:hypothetical protein [Lactobacillaceae bacterium]